MKQKGILLQTMKHICVAVLTLTLIFTMMPVTGLMQCVNADDTNRNLNNPKLVFDRYGSWDTVYFGNYPQGANGEIEPIRWIVLSVDNSNHEALLLSDKCLDYRQFNETDIDEITWDNSSIREWLNSETTNDSFYNTAFSNTEKQAIKATSGTCSDASETDKVFLLSSEEASNSDYGLGANISRMCETTQYVRSLINEYGSGSMWWTRTCYPGYSGYSSSRAYRDGSGIGGDSPSITTKNCVRPAIYIDLSSSTWKKGDRADARHFGGTFTYEENTKTLTISGTSAGYFLDPWETYDDTIRDGFEHIVINEGVTSIGEGFGFRNLVSLVLPTNLTTISNAFNDTSLKSLSLDVNDSISNSFENITTLRSLSLSNVKTIDDSAFSNCTSLEEIVLPPTFKRLGENVFSGCTGLKKVVIPRSVTQIDDSAFADCGNSFKIDTPTESRGYYFAKVNGIEITHEFVETADSAKAATCTESGKEPDQKCINCDEFKEGKIIDALGHKIESVAKVEPTYEAEGTEAYWTCSTCGKLFSDADGKNEITEPTKIAKLEPIDSNQPAVDPVNQKGADGTALGAGASAEAAEKAITSMKNDNDPAGSKFSTLKFRSSKQANNAITLNWNKAKGTTQYVVYGNMCGKKNKMKKIGTTKKTTFVVKKAGKKLAKGKNYKFILVALDKKNNVVSTSKVVHVVTAGTKAGNYKAVTINKKVIANAKKLKKGKTLKLGAKLVPVAKKKVAKHVGLRYETTNNKIATVSAKGVIKAKAKGTCYVNAFAQNGVFKTVKVVVK